MANNNSMMYDTNRYPAFSFKILFISYVYHNFTFINSHYSNKTTTTTTTPTTNPNLSNPSDSMVNNDDDDEQKSDESFERI